MEDFDRKHAPEPLDSEPGCDSFIAMVDSTMLQRLLDLSIYTGFFK